MKHWAMGMRILGVVLVAGLLFGCEKNQPPDEAAPYDSTTAVPPTNLQVNPNPDLLADQTKLAGAKPAVSAVVSASAADDPVAKAVRAEMGKMIDAAKTGQLPTITAYVLEKDTNTVKDAADALTALTAAEDALNTAVKATWGKEALASLMTMLERGPNGGPFLARLGTMSADALAITTVDANTAEVKGPAGDKLTFTKSEDKWLISLSDAQVQVYSALAELAKLQTQAANGLAGDVATNAVTAQTAVSAIAEKAKTLDEAVKRLKEAMETGQSGTGSSGPATAPAGGADSGSSGPATAPAGGADSRPSGPATAPAGGADSGSSGPATAPAGGADSGSSGPATAPAGGADSGSSGPATAPASGAAGGN